MLRWDDCAPKPWCTKPVAKPLLPHLEKPCNDPGIRHPTTNSRRGIGGCGRSEKLYEGCRPDVS